MIPILLIIIIYCILIILIYAKVKYDIQDKVIKSKNKFSIIIASKNEGLNIRNLIESLKKINYLNNYYEIIFVDDHSVDNTREIIQTEISNLKNAKYLFVTKKNYAGKKGAIDFGINNALYENIVITDSDCIVPPDWLNEINNKINEGVDFVIGISPFLQYKKLINQLSCFENLRSNIITIFSVKIKLPFTACARNLCFKKSFYNQINGFANLQKTLSGDDDLLLKEAINNKLSIDTLFNDKSFVFSKSKNTYNDFFNQKLRHTSTSYHYSLRQSFFPFLWHSFNSLVFFSPVLSFINITYFIPFFVKLLFDIFVIMLMQKKFNYKFGIFEIIYFQLLYELLIIFKFPISYFYKKRW